MDDYLIIFLLFVLPLIVLPLGSSIFEGTKVFIAEIIIELLFLKKIFTVKKLSLSNFSSLRLILLSILFCLTILDLIFLNSKDSFFGNNIRYQGIFLLWNLMLFSFLTKKFQVSKIIPQIPFVALILLLVSTIGFGLNPADRYYGSLGEPNALAATAVFFLPFIWFRSKNLVRFISFLITLVIIFLSGSRTGLISLGAEFIFISLTQFLKVSTVKSLIISLFVLLFSLGLPFLESNGWFENRSDVWLTALYAGYLSPIIGNGFGNLQQAILHSAQKLNNNVQYQIVDSSHNFILDYWVEGGIIGVITLISLLILSLKSLVLKKENLKIAVFIGVVSSMLFNPSSIVTLLAFWWLIGSE